MIEHEDHKLLVIWKFHDAPADPRDLSTHGGDEDWLIIAHRLSDGGFALPLGLHLLVEVLEEEEDSYLDGWGHVDRHVLDGGSVVVIFAHA